MKIKRHDLGTHFGGASRLKKTKSEDFKQHILRNIKKCLDVKSYDQYPYSDGVYLIDGMCYVIVEGDETTNTQQSRVAADCPNERLVMLENSLQTLCDLMQCNV